MAQRQTKPPKAEESPKDPTTKKPLQQKASLQCSWCGRIVEDVTQVDEYCGVPLPNMMACTGTLKLFSPQREQRGGCCAKGCSMPAVWYIEWDAESDDGYTLACIAHVGSKLQPLNTNVVTPLM